MSRDQGYDPDMRNCAWEVGLKQYQLLVSDYTGRNISYNADILNAFSGISAVFTEQCGGNFFYGITESVFHLALLWIPLGPGSRRQLAVLGEPFPQVELPSWSWAGWVNQVIFLQSEIELWERDQDQTVYRNVGSFVILNNTGMHPLSLHHRQGCSYWCLESEGRLHNDQDDIGDDIDDISVEEDYFSDDIDPTAIEVNSVRTNPAVPILIFNAFVIKACHFTVNEFDFKLVPGVDYIEHINPFSYEAERSPSVLFAEGQQCGILYGYDSSIWPPSHPGHEKAAVAQYEFVLVSSFSSVHCSVPSRKSFCTKYAKSYGIVLLVEWKAEYAERVAIAIIDMDVFDKAAPEQKLIRLA